HLRLVRRHKPFEPHPLTRLQLDEFKKAIRPARERLADLVQLHLDPAPPEQLRQAGHDFAVAGHPLYQPVFAPPAQQLPRAAAVRDWLADLQRISIEADTLESVAILADGQTGV